MEKLTRAMTELQTESDHCKQFVKAAKDDSAKRVMMTEMLLHKAKEEFQDKNGRITALEKHLQEANNQVSEVSQELRSTENQLHYLQQEHESDKEELTRVKRELKQSYMINQEFSRPQYQEKASPSSQAASLSQRRMLSAEMDIHQHKVPLSQYQESPPKNPRRSSFKEADPLVMSLS